MKPTVGRIVLYRLTQENVDHCAYKGMGYKLGDVAPMIITWVNEPPSSFGPAGSVNGQVFCDGPEVLWVKGLQEGTEPGQWSWLRGLES